MGKTFQVVVNGVRGDKSIIDLCNTDEQMKSMTVLQLKEKIRHKVPELAENNMRLIFADRSLDEDSDSLSSFGIQHMSIIMVVLKVPGGVMA